MLKPELSGIFTRHEIFSQFPQQFLNVEAMFSWQALHSSFRENTAYDKKIVMPLWRWLVPLQSCSPPLLHGKPPSWISIYTRCRLLHMCVCRNNTFLVFWNFINSTALYICSSTWPHSLDSLLIQGVQVYSSQQPIRPCVNTPSLRYQLLFVETPSWASFVVFFGFVLSFK